MLLLVPIMDYFTKLSVFLWFLPYSIIGNSNDIEKIIKYNLDGVTPDILKKDH